MLKYVGLLKRKDGVTREAFVDHYENVHVPLVVGLCPQILSYRRNYLDSASAAALGFDVITEFLFADRAAFEGFGARCAEPEVAAVLAADVADLFDGAATRMMVVDERGGAIAGRGAAADDAGLRALQDERAILRGLARFARILDTKEWAGLGDVFADDLDFDYGQGERSGMAALTDQMRRYLDRCGGTQHLLGSILVDVDGDTAVSRAYVQARHQRVGDAGSGVFDSNGEYVDRWKRRGAGWRIVRRDARWATHSGDPAILGAGSDELG